MTTKDCQGQGRKSGEKKTDRWTVRYLRKALLAGVVLAPLVGTGCNLMEYVHNGFKVGPNYSKPPAPVAEEWIEARNDRVSSEPVDLTEWWKVFNDPALNQLIETAYQQNITLRIAGARVLFTRAELGIAVGNFFPQEQGAQGAFSRIKTSDKAAFRPPTQWFSNWQKETYFAWELDFWGRFRRAIEAADGELDASIENYDDILVILLAEVATRYVEMRTFQLRLEYARENVRIQEGSLRIAEDRFKFGASTERDVQQARTILEQTRSLIPDLELGLRVANNRLCYLLGIPPRDLTLDLVRDDQPTSPPPPAGAYPYARTAPASTSSKETGKDSPAEKAKENRLDRLVPSAPPQVAVGIPADLLRRRPDVRRAERQAAAQSARIGVAESDWYPHIFVSGNLGLQSEQFWQLFNTPGSMIGSIGPSFNWQLLNYGRILNNVRAQDARFQELAFNYQDRVLNAGREAEDAIATFLQAQRRYEALRKSVDAAVEAVRITEDQYRQGAVDYTAVFLAQSELTFRQDALGSARGEIARGLIAIYKALGGGWDLRLIRECGPDGAPAGPNPASPAISPASTVVPAIHPGVGPALPPLTTSGPVMPIPGTAAPGTPVSGRTTSP